MGGALYDEIESALLLGEQRDLIGAAHLRVVALATSEDRLDKYLHAALDAIFQRGAADYLTVAIRDNLGQWSPIAEAGRRHPLPTPALVAAVDAAEPVLAADWLTVALHGDKSLSLVLAVRSTPELIKTLQYRAALTAHLLGYGVGLIRQRVARSARLKRLEQLLTIIESWQKTRDMHTLLTEMAEAAAELFGSERASIFLWDRPKKTLVGRPALGIEGGELRVPDDRGVVGHVVQTGEPRRVDELDKDEINRDIDQSLAFHTRNLLCVPLVGRRGRIFGAFELINKQLGNFTAEDQLGLTELAAHASSALENTQETERILASRNRLADAAAAAAELIGDCPAIATLRGTIRRVAESNLPVLVLGENGTGKEVVSQSIHFRSDRRAQPLVAVNCAAVPDTLLESELFGREKGAFTGADETRPGKFEMADGGTLFLDEIGDLSLSGQSKLLRVLEDQLIMRVGGTSEIQVDVRIIAATNRDLGELVREKKFREDLFFRLHVVTIELPPLRERGTDILTLANHFLHHFSLKTGRQTPTLSEAAQRRLLAHAWPGNVRELRNTMERVIFLHSDEVIQPESLQFHSLDSHDDAPMNLPLNDATAEFQRRYIQRHVDAAQGNISAAAEKIGMHRSNLYRKMKQLEMLSDSTPSSAGE
ncbi:sigma-54 interaction domain-containing protein [Blastopirellula marina]|uniref:Probable two-component response regulator n=1 Tax=Blastopirellula marina DSM 3645 TaxID=314230 RepID=A3ZU96_9BACT|nr:sigma-54-dependent Fis family transcriptional regulator [Blastopirellula marina]EAQ79799.1 probable two-component response regulator [Blastopirellula marina DSM 3645]